MRILTQFKTVEHPEAHNNVAMVPMIYRADQVEGLCRYCRSDKHISWLSPSNSSVPVSRVPIFIIPSAGGTVDNLKIHFTDGILTSLEEINDLGNDCRFYFRIETARDQVGDYDRISVYYQSNNVSKRAAIISYRDSSDDDTVLRYYQIPGYLYLQQNGPNQYLPTLFCSWHLDGNGEVVYEYACLQFVLSGEDPWSLYLTAQRNTPDNLLISSTMPMPSLIHKGFEDNMAWSEPPIQTLQAVLGLVFQENRDEFLQESFSNLKLNYVSW